MRASLWWRLRWLTSVLAVAKVRRHRNQPRLPHTHSPQGQIQSVDHFVCPQHHVLEVLVVVSEEMRPGFHDDSDLSETIGCLRYSRGEEQRAVHQRAVVVIADQVVHLGGLVTQFGPVGGLDVHAVVGVVEVDDVNVEDEHS